MKAIYVLAAAIVVTVLFAARAAFSEGNPNRGRRIFGACAACHSLQPDQNMTGPSLADLWNRQAGSVASFNRYSPALQSSNIVWNDKTLDEWIKDPQQVVPGNQMTFAGIKDNQQRTDLLAFLKEATRKENPQTAQQGGAGGMMGGMGGMMGGGQVPNLKHPDPTVRIHTISYCKGTYTITMANGQTRKFWERNIRLKTDSSSDGPERNAPGLVPAGMMGDRADVIFVDPGEISGFIKPQC